MVKPRYAVAAVLLFLLLILVVQNTEIVAVRLLFWELRMSRVILIVMPAVVGFVCGYVAARLVGARRKR